ncbi:Poly(A)-specific ribonuclease PARN-like domain-containing protein 1 [Camponotus floridanus]|uniref:Poly(A)-specific ribonuclease PARN-like domain-containing protein 1 n=1 Tax=Camponotus floridanus TaxID=104421 RepID=E2ANM1_CAMFO|nr:Poly(A)-specific ribonuclease PARN-like domain-containing protein 1 [Camponotus floridanus]
MFEVTNENFNTIYPHLERTLKNASFIAIDTELTGLNVDDVKNSLFDSINERYEKQRSSIQPYIIIQFGITAFQRIQHENQYTAEAFNFFLLPRSIPSKNRQFVWQVAALEFLTAYEFDFNKFAYNGISYLNEDDQAILQQQLEENVLFHNVERSMSYREEDSLKDYINQVFEWLNTASDETNSLKIDTPTPILQYLTHKELRNRFPNVWTFSGNNMVTVMKIRPDSRAILEQEEGSILENVLLESYIGFSKVFKLLVTLKKPIVAHNALLDLMFMYQQFYKPLPKKYTNFKDSLHQLFPTIYDTKFLSFELREHLSTEQKWKFNSLSGLVEYFTEKQGKYLALGSPNINLTCKINSDKSNVVPSTKYHTAGWDSYFAGYVFIRLIHVFSAKCYGQSSTLKHFTHTELMNNVKSFANCINIIRGSTSHLKLDGPEPGSTRPKWLFVKTLASKPITAMQIAEKMSSFGAVDIKQCTSKRMLVAVANHGRGSIAVSSGLLTWLLHQKLQRSS